MNDKTYSQADLDKAIGDTRTAAHAEGHTAGHVAGKAEGMKAANDRLIAVTSSEHYAGREATALKLLTTTDMSSDTLSGVLATVTKAPAAAEAPAVPGNRASQAPGGLAVASAPGVEIGADAANKPDTRSDFEKGRDKSKALKNQAVA